MSDDDREPASETTQQFLNNTIPTCKLCSYPAYYTLQMRDFTDIYQSYKYDPNSDAAIAAHIRTVASTHLCKLHAKHILNAIHHRVLQWENRERI